jgi:hypothetical protein
LILIIGKQSLETIGHTISYCRQMMKGLELCEQYFREQGLPIFKRNFPSLIGRMAAGLVGNGSDCFGFDDEISRDHDWGPGFCIWLNQCDYRLFSQDIEEALQKLPAGFKGFSSRNSSIWGEKRVGVFETGDFYSTFIGLTRIPETNDEWMSIPENNLAACTNGRIFHDPFGEFTSLRNSLLDFYPEDVRLKKIAARCMSSGQSGQYNFPRCCKRKDFFAAQYAETKFCSDIISIVFLFNRKYSPFYKWMHRALPDLKLLGTWMFHMISKLVTIRDITVKEEIIEEMSLALIETIRNSDLSSSNSTFLADHGPEILTRIQDPILKSKDVWVG